MSATRFGKPRHHHRRTDSTNDRARVLAEAGAPHGTVVTASEQSAGRGRRGRTWNASPGTALLYTGILRPLEQRHSLLPLAVAVAVAEAVESVAPVTCELKWPNDVWIDRRKVAGILIESRPPRWALIGIGLNVAIADHEFPPDLRWPATSIGNGVAVDAALAALDERLGEWVGEPAGRVVDEFRGRDGLLGRRLGWTGAAGARPDGVGTAAGIDEQGNLLVDADGGGRVGLGSGEVQLAMEPPPAGHGRR